MVTPEDLAFRARLQTLYDQYAASVPAMMITIEQAGAVCASAGRSTAHMTALNRALHAVAGSAGTFGFSALGHACRRLEHGVRDVMDNPQAADAAWPRLAQELAQLLRCTAADPRSLPGYV
ncbi:MAG: Hpt domain-containing protein [Pseudomonadota bacterium]